MDIVSDTIPQIMANCLFSFWHSSYLIHLNFCIKTKSKNIQVHNWHKTKLFEISWPKYKEIHEHFLNYHLFQILHKKKQTLFFFCILTEICRTKKKAAPMARQTEISFAWIICLSCHGSGFFFGSTNFCQNAEEKKMSCSIAQNTFSAQTQNIKKCIM